MTFRGHSVDFFKRVYLGFAVGNDYAAFRSRNEILYSSEIFFRKDCALFYGKGVAAYYTYVVVQFFGRGRRFAYVGDDFSVFKLYYSVAVNFGELSVVRDDYDETGFRKLFKRFEHLLARCGVERARRLVRHYYARLFYECAGDCYSLFLSARESVRLAAGVIFKLYFL